MPDLKTKSSKREFSTEKKKAPKLIIGDPLPSTSSFVEEKIIKLDPSAGPRGVGPGSKPGAGVTIGSEVGPKKKRPTSGGVEGMGGRHLRPRR